ncbi:MAG: cobaltochelatase subunit CobN [Cellvibrionaceae bacterium]|nr:cobaltochelatase subunit CobN [Cellvibrionaceae bacterium]
MHLLASQPGGFSEQEGIVDLGQTPADMVILSAADSALAALASVAQTLPEDFPSVRLANCLHLSKPAAFDLYRHKVLEQSSLVVVSLLGGMNYWPYAVEQLQHWAGEAAQRQLIIVPGDDSPDAAVFEKSTVTSDQAVRVWRYLREGGTINYRQLFCYLASEYLGRSYPWNPPQVLARAILYLPQSADQAADATSATTASACLIDYQQRWQSNARAQSAPICLLLFYRSHLQSANTAMFDQLIEQLENQDLRIVALAISSLKEAESLSAINNLLQALASAQPPQKAALIINTTGFASQGVSSPELCSAPTTFQSPFMADVPVLQLILASSTEQDWRQYSQGLHSRDIAMQVVLPEMDGRIITRAVSFKAESWFCERCEIAVIRYALAAERAQWVAALAAHYCRLGRKPNSDKRIALLLANYPTKDGRIGNGVGLDTPASAMQLLTALQAQGYQLGDEALPADGDALIEALLGAVTNNPTTLHQRPCWQSLPLADYQRAFAQLDPASQAAVMERWGPAEADPKYRQGRLMLSGMRLGNVFVGIQPARGFDRDLAATYHDPDLVPPHSYLAFYFWLRQAYDIDAVIHLGKHGNLEWLPGKGTALSAQCWPDIALGPVPHFYPFIVNDPGEGAQAKRRSQAVIIDHLMPPLGRADTYGELAELEALVDEYYQALGLDSRREQWLQQQILALITDSHIADELPGINNADADQDTLLSALDNYLCDIKEAQIRQGLHILGTLPAPDKLCDTLVALLRLPRGTGVKEQGILHNLVSDLDLHNSPESDTNTALFDPLQTAVSPWCGSQPAILAELSSQPWRTTADTRERLECLATALINTYVLKCEPDQALVDNTISTQLPRTCEQLYYVKDQLMAALHTSAQQEIAALIAGLNGRFIAPGPSGAPSRGRWDTLPTGRNFFSVDNRAIPSQAACAIGEKSAQALLERHLQEQGDYPKQLGLSVWGTATMRTGGDDIAQAFALMGVKPVRAPGSQRVVDIEIIPCMLLGRPRVDVTLRVSGFFRDAFPNVMRLYDKAVLALAAYDEPGGDNTVQSHIQARTTALMAEGLSAQVARRQASYRVFGSKPGAYGAGLQGLIDERCWQGREDLADAYINWSAYAYGAPMDQEGSQASAVAAEEGLEGTAARRAFEYQLAQLDTVVHNQDNREHDILDSDDYYQFQGGMVNAVTALSGSEPAVYLNDHANPAAPRVRTLKEELNRVLRSRVLNPKWIKAMQQHGYKGAFEMAATVDYIFAYDATTNMIDDYQYQQVADALVFDPANRAFMEAHNPNAYEEMAERLLEATQRGMWADDQSYGERLQDLLLEIDNRREVSL